MNNNYHTQLGKSKNILNDVAINNKINTNIQDENSQPYAIDMDAQLSDKDIELSENSIEKNIKNQPEPVKQLPPKQQQKIVPKRQMVEPFKKRLAVPEKKSTKKNTIYEFLIIPIVLLVLFIFLAHPASSKLLKFLPNLNNKKGYILRGVILAAIYIILQYVGKLKKN